MNKKLISLAVAAALTAPAAAMADATLYGQVRVALEYFDQDVSAYEKFEGWELNSYSSRLGVKGSEDLGGGLKAIYQIEMEIPITNANDYIDDGDKGEIKMRNSFAGLAGNWGTALLGHHDTPLKISTAKLDLFNDTVADYAKTVRFLDVRADGTIAYISPTFSGFQLAGAIIPAGGATVDGSYNVNADGLADGWSLAAIYSNGPFYGSVAYEEFGKDTLAECNDIDSWNYWCDTPDDNFDHWRFGLGLLDWNGFTLDGIYEYQEQGDFDADIWQLQAGYAFGNNQVIAMYGQYDASHSEYCYWWDSDQPYCDSDTWAIGFLHNFSKRTQAYIMYTDVDVTDDSYNWYDEEPVRVNDGDWSAFSLGFNHKF